MKGNKRDFSIAPKSKASLNEGPKMLQQQVRVLSLDRAIQAHATDKEINIVELAKEIEEYVNRPFE
jgi:hypothetical protein